MDNQLVFCEELAVTAAAQGTNSIDLDVVRDIGTGTPIYLHVLVTETMDDSSDDSELQPELHATETSTYAAAEILQTFTPIPATTAAGEKFVYALNPLSPTFKHLWVYFRPIDGNLSAGKFSAWLSPIGDKWAPKASAHAIS